MWDVMERYATHLILFFSLFSPPCLYSELLCCSVPGSKKKNIFEIWEDFVIKLQ